MKRGSLVVAVIAVLVGLGATAAADEGTDNAIEKLDQQFANVNSYTAKTDVMTNTDFGPEQTYKSEMVGTTEWQRRGDKALMRSDTKCKTTQTESGNTTVTQSVITVVDDGEFLYSMTQEDGQVTVVKSRSLSVQSSQPKGYFAQLKRHYDIKLLKDEKVDGHDCCVFEMKMKPMEGVPPSGRQRVSYWKDHGILIKSEGFGADGKLITSSISKDIKINTDIGAGRFKFDIPEGAQVVDATSPPMQPAQTESEPVKAEKAEKAEEAEKAKGKEEKAEKKEEKKEEGKLKKIIKLPKWPKKP